jgi:hypothetical protein
MTAGLVFVPVTTELLEATSAEWLTKWAEQDDRPPVYTEPLDACRRTLAGETMTSSLSTAVWYAVVADGEEAALALVDLVHTHKGGQLRAHRVIVEPSLEQSSGLDPERRDYVSLVAATALIGMLDLTLDAHPSSSLKIWCSYPMTKHFLDASLERFRERLSVQVAGNWLTINFLKK